VLLLVLACLLIITVLAVAFLQAAGTERRSSSVFQATAETQQLSDTVVNLVEGEITAATQSGQNNSWASQPGAIWTFTNTGALNQIYRLYSWNSMTDSSATDFLGTDASGTTGGDPSQLTSWYTGPAWVDLNAPATSTEGTASGLTYPIVDPGLQVDGFGILSNKPSGPNNNGAPMPVQWLYVLKDGTIIPVPKGATGTKITWTTNAPTPANPIVGRIAYWTDDDTCKININTAGGDYSPVGTETGPPTVSKGADGTWSVPPSDNYDTTANASFWDVPHFNASDEITNDSVNQPINGEFQRYPGHPATVGLSSILSSLFGSPITGPTLYGLTPRYTYGGSYGATTKTLGSGAQIPLKADRLYASLEEMLFSSSLRTPQPQLSSYLKQVEQAKFFLTANSRAPELNLFGEPRISMWPVSNTLSLGSTVTANSSYTAMDEVLALDSTLVTSGNTLSPYYFVRQSSVSPTTDAAIPRNTNLLNYLDQLTSIANPIPGFGGTFAGKYGTTGKRQILTEIFDYIRTINSEDPNLNGGQTSQHQYATGTPGSGNSTFQGISVGIGQITPSVNPLGWGTMGLATFPLLHEAEIQFVGLGRGKAGSPPTAIPYNPSQFGQVLNPGAPAWDTTTDPTGHTPAVGYTAVQAFLLLDFINPGHYMPTTENCPCFVVSVGGNLSNMIITPNGGAQTNFGFPNPNHTTPPSPAYDSIATKWDFMGAGDDLAGYLDFRALTYGRTLTPYPTRNPSGNNFLGSLIGGYYPQWAWYPFYSGIISVPTTGTNTMTVSGPDVDPVTHLPGSTSITVSIYPPSTLTYTNVNGISGPAPTAAPLQTYTLSFPPLNNIPIPGVAASGTAVVNGASVSVGPTVGTTLTTDRWQQTSLSMITTADVVQGLVMNYNQPWSGDARMLAIQNVPAGAFTKHPDYGTRTFAYGLNSPGENIIDANQTPNGSLGTAGYLVSGASAAPSTYPLVPPGLSGALYSNGSPSWDWDNGVGSYPDGPYINKADEGSQDNEPNVVPYLTWNKPNVTGGVFFSPNRQIPSPGMLGSLPTGIDPTGNNPAPWQTLLFRPDSSHPESKAVNPNNPEDELFLDLFWMPTADPYPISEAFSSAGKINLNYEIVPFTYIIRNTGVRAVLSSEKVAQISIFDSADYKEDRSILPTYNHGIAARTSINLGLNTTDDGGTLQQFRDLFNGEGNFSLSTAGAPSIFRSASQICDIYLVPKGYSWLSKKTAQNAWYGRDFAMVGDNVRERPYADIYGRVTTKSNTYTVYYTVQALKYPSSLASDPTNSASWDESQGKVVGEYRGSTSIERYLDPTNTGSGNNGIIDYAPATPSNPTSIKNLEGYYRWRVVQSHQFIP
jgi:uncharacterized protein (TIGR02600 family)